MKEVECIHDLSIPMVAIVIIEKNLVVRNAWKDKKQGIKYSLVETPSYKEVLTTKVEKIYTCKR